MANAKPAIVHFLKPMQPVLSLFETPAWRRRDCLVMAGLALGLGPALAQRSAATLPAAQSLPQELARAMQNKQPLVVMVSLDGCVFCRQARHGHLSPMHKDGMVIVQVDMRSSQTVVDFEGRRLTHDQLTRTWKVSIAPTLLFFGPQGKEVAERMEGAYLPDFYGQYLEERMAQGRKALGALAS